MLPKKGFIIPRARNQDYLPAVWNVFSQSSLVTKKYHGINIKQSLFFKDGKALWIFKESDWKKTGQHLLNRFVREKDYFTQIYNKQKQVGLRTINLTHRIIKVLKNSDLTILELVKLIAKLENLWVEYDQINVLPWYLGSEPVKDYLFLKLGEVGVTNKEIESLLFPKALSLAAQEEIAVLNAASNVKTFKSLSEAANKLSYDFGWMPFGYDGPEYWSSDHYFKVLKQKHKNVKAKINKITARQKEIQQHQNRILKDYKISSESRRLLDIVQKLIIMTDYRKKVEFTIHYALFLTLNKISKETGLSLKELKFLDVSEILRMVKREEYPKYKTIAAKRIASTIEVKVKNGKLQKIIFGKEADKNLYKRIASSGKITEVKGTTASIGKVKIRARVKKILFSKDMGIMKNGEVLVTAMTTPDFVPAMRKAIAIVTDEGGLTCHAAIVSRELGITAIIGTKIATSVFENGDMVEVDANKGIVRKINAKK